jgi:hypothetical protein
MPGAKASVRIVPAWGERKAAGGAAGGVKPVTPVLNPVRPVWSLQGASLVFVLVRSLGFLRWSWFWWLVWRVYRWSVC